jgi:hypothetical protein
MEAPIIGPVMRLSVMKQDQPVPPHWDEISKRENFGDYGDALKGNSGITDLRWKN